jgi:hypothetical protein
MSKGDLLKMPDDSEGNMRALLATPHGTAGSRKAAAKPKKKAKQKQRKRKRKRRG